MQKIIVILGIVVILTGCTSRESNSKSDAVQIDSTHANSNTQKEKSDAHLYSDSVMGLKVFTDIPDSLTGCSDDFYVDTLDMKDRQHIFFASFMTDQAMIKVGGKILYLNRDTTIHNSTKPTYLKAFEGNGYRVSFKMTQIQKYDEGGFYKGILELSHEGKMVTINIIGESGC